MDELEGHWKRFSLTDGEGDKFTWPPHYQVKPTPLPRSFLLEGLSTWRLSPEPLSPYGALIKGSWCATWVIMSSYLINI